MWWSAAGCDTSAASIDREKLARDERHPVIRWVPRTNDLIISPDSGDCGIADMPRMRRKHLLRASRRDVRVSMRLRILSLSEITNFKCRSSARLVIVTEPRFFLPGCIQTIGEVQVRDEGVAPAWGASNATRHKIANVSRGGM